VDLALHWSYIIDSMAYLYTYRLNDLRKGDEHPVEAYIPLRSMASFTFLL